MDDPTVITLKKIPKYPNRVRQGRPLRARLGSVSNTILQYLFECDDIYKIAQTKKKTTLGSLIFLAFRRKIREITITITMDLFQDFSSKENLKRAFLYLKNEADDSDLPLDPIWRPSISAVAQLGDELFEALQEYLRQNKYQPDKADFIYADKDNMGVRPVCVFSVIDRIVFQALLNPSIFGDKIDSRLHSSCFGNRILGKEKYLKPYKIQWTKFCDKQIKAFDKKFVWRIEFDMQTYYENIHLDTLFRILNENLQIQDESLLKILEKQLKAWVEKPTMCGIPQSVNASHILANAYLYPLDTFVDDLISNGDFEYFRYVDDIVIMAESAEKILSIASQIVAFLRGFNLNLNEKTKLEKLKNTKSIEELKFYNPYGQLNETSIQKVIKISKKVPNTLRKIKRGAEVKKTEISSLRYYLKAEWGIDNPKILDDLITIIPKRPSLIFPISKYIGFYLSDIYRLSSPKNLSSEDKEFFRKIKELNYVIYKKIWKTYCENSFSVWTKFWLLKILSASLFSIEYPDFQSELNQIVINPNAKFLRPIAFFYKAYMREQVGFDAPLGFNLDDIKRHIRNSKTETEKAIYYYFIIYLSRFEENEATKEIIYEALQSKSAEIQTMGLFLVKKLYHLFEASPSEVDSRDLVIKWNIKLEREITGELSRIYFKLPPPKKPEAKKEVPTEGDYLTFEGKIAKDQLAPFFLGTPQIRKIKRGERDKLRFYPTTGDISYKDGKDEVASGDKGFALLSILNESKNTPFNIKDIKNHCNPLVNNPIHKFKSEKDIYDTIRLLKSKLEVKKGAYFPIEKKGAKTNKKWVWVEK